MTFWNAPLRDTEHRDLDAMAREHRAFGEVITRFRIHSDQWARWRFWFDEAVHRAGGHRDNG